MNYDTLKLENQLCFPLYACSKEVVRLYTPFLKEIDLTYTQYIVLLVLWEQGAISIKQLGEQLFLDTGTLTPLLKKLEQKNLIKRERDQNDERVVMIETTQEGIKLQEKAKSIPEQIGSCIPLTAEEAVTLYKLLYKVLNQLKEEDTDDL